MRAASDREAADEEVDRRLLLIEGRRGSCNLHQHRADNGGEDKRGDGHAHGVPPFTADWVSSTLGGNGRRRIRGAPRSSQGWPCGTLEGVRIFSGIQPTGAKHFGNWSGGFRQYAATQERAVAAGGRAFFCIVDLHSITVDYDPADLRERSLDLAALLFSTGLDPERSTVFAQSHVTAHA